MFYPTLPTLFALCSLGHLAAAAPTLDARAAAKAVARGAPITWTGKILDDRDEYTLHGDASSILHQIRSIRPDYNASSFSSNHELHTRGLDLGKRNKNGGNCGSFANGDLSGIASQMSSLLDLGGSCTVGAGPGACSRLGCMDTSAIYLCNDNPQLVSPSCSYLAGYVNDILRSCGGAQSSISGQEFDTDGYSVVAAYGNCHDSTDVPSSFYTGPGPNGMAGTICNNCMKRACDRVCVTWVDLRERLA